MKEVHIIGSGFSALSASSYLAQAGYKVNVYEKNEDLGGRAREFKVDGFRFDMGPSWYWMPDVFESFFADFGYQVSDFYQLKRLSPSYRVYFAPNDYVDLPTDLEDLYQLFEDIETGSSQHLKAFLKDAEYNYGVAMNKIVQLPGFSPLELVTFETVSRVSQFFTHISQHIQKKIKNPKLVQILEFPVLFLGAKPSNTPYFYCFMNHADLTLGTWYPEGGMHEIVKSMVKLAQSLGVQFHTKSAVNEIVVENKKVKGLKVNGELIEASIVISGADYAHSEQLLAPEYRMYSSQYWENRVFAPSSLLFYVGFNKKIEGVLHHTLCFDADFNKHAEEIYDEAKWPTSPLFYANFTTKTDPLDAPNGCETGFFLMPIAPGIEDTDEIRETYFNRIIKRLELLTNQDIMSYIVYKKSFCVKDFISEYNSYKGNAYGLANTLKQTAFLKPKLKSKKVDNLYFTGQLTVPGPGVPPALISGKIVSQLITKTNNH